MRTVRTALPKKTGLVALLRLNSTPIDPAPPPSQAWPTETIPEDILRSVMRIGGAMKERSLRAEFARTGALYNSCPLCGATLEPVTLDGMPLMGCPHRNDSRHRTGAMPKLSASIAPQEEEKPLSSPVRTHASQAAKRMAKEQLEAFARFRRSFFGKPDQAISVLQIQAPSLPHLSQEDRKVAFESIKTIPAAHKSAEITTEIEPVDERVFSVDAIIEELAPVEVPPSALQQIGTLAETAPDEDTLMVPIAVREKIQERYARDKAS